MDVLKIVEKTEEIWFEKLPKAAWWAFRIIFITAPLSVAGYVSHKIISNVVAGFMVGWSYSKNIDE